MASMLAVVKQTALLGFQNFLIFNFLLFWLSAYTLFFLFGDLHVPLIALSQFIGAHGTDVSVGVRILSGETLLQAKNSTGRNRDSNQGPCRQHGHCCKRTKPLRHQGTILCYIFYSISDTRAPKHDSGICKTAIFQKNNNYVCLRRQWELCHYCYQKPLVGGGISQHVVSQLHTRQSELVDQ